MAYLCLLRFNITPSAFIEMSKKEKAFILACLEIEGEEKRKHEKELENKMRR